MPEDIHHIPQSQSSIHLWVISASVQNKEMLRDTEDDIAAALHTDLNLQKNIVVIIIIIQILPDFGVFHYICR